MMKQLWCFVMSWNLHGMADRNRKPSVRTATKVDKIYTADLSNTSQMYFYLYLNDGSCCSRCIKHDTCFLAVGLQIGMKLYKTVKPSPI
jgi:hypothetical protein